MPGPLLVAGALGPTPCTCERGSSSAAVLMSGPAPGAVGIEAQAVETYEDGDERARDGEVWDHELARVAGQIHHGGDGEQLVAYNDGVRGLQSQVGTDAAHRDAGVGGGQRR